MDVIDYEVFGNEMRYVELELDAGEAAIGEAGSLFYMDPGIDLETVFGDGSAQQDALKRRVAFAAPDPGKIVPIDLSRIGGTLIAQRDAFLCAARGVSLGIAFQRKSGTGFFGGEGFIMEKLDGDGMVFVHAGGTILERQLAPGEVLPVDTGCVVAYQPSLDFDVQYVGKVKTALFGGEGLFFATLRGPGHIWLQSLPFSRLASRVFAAAPQSGGKGRDEGGFGSLIGATAVGGLLGGLLGGDEDA